MSANDSKSAETAAADDALAKAETALQLEADKRMREVKAEAASNAKAEGESEKPANPDG